MDHLSSSSLSLSRPLDFFLSYLASCFALSAAAEDGPGMGAPEAADFPDEAAAAEATSAAGGATAAAVMRLRVGRRVRRDGLREDGHAEGRSARRDLARRRIPRGSTCLHSAEIIRVVSFCRPSWRLLASRRFRLQVPWLLRRSRGNAGRSSAARGVRIFALDPFSCPTRIVRVFALVHPYPPLTRPLPESPHVVHRGPRRPWPTAWSTPPSLR